MSFTRKPASNSASQQLFTRAVVPDLARRLPTRSNQFSAGFLALPTNRHFLRRTFAGVSLAGFRMAFSTPSRRTTSSLLRSCTVVGNQAIGVTDFQNEVPDVQRKCAPVGSGSFVTSPTGGDTQDREPRSREME